MKTSASQVARLFQCPGSFTLPVVRETSDAASLGIEIHRFLFAVLRYGRDEALMSMPVDMRSTCADLLVPEVSLSDQAQGEVAMAYDPVSGAARVYGEGMQHGWTDHVAWQGSLSGVADLIDIGPDIPLVLDWKTGNSVGPPSQNPQLLALGLMVARAHTRTHVRLAVGYVSPGRDPVVVYELVGPMELDAFEAKIRTALTSFPRDEFETGASCKYCPAFHSCPVMGKFLNSLARGSETLDSVEAVEFASKAVERAKSALKKRAEVEPIPMNDGRVYGPRSHVRETVAPDAGEYIDVALGLGASGRTASWAWSSLEAEAKHQGISKDDLRARLRALGALEEDVVTRVEAYRP